MDKIFPLETSQPLQLLVSFSQSNILKELNIFNILGLIFLSPLKYGFQCQYALKRQYAFILWKSFYSQLHVAKRTFLHLPHFLVTRMLLIISSLLKYSLPLVSVTQHSLFSFYLSGHSSISSVSSSFHALLSLDLDPTPFLASSFSLAPKCSHSTASC